MKEAVILDVLKEQNPEIDTFDWAIPLYHFKRLCDIAGENVSGHIVTAYGPQVHGIIMGVTPEGKAWVESAYPG